MDIETRFIRAMAQAIDNHFLRGGPYPDDTAILAIAPELTGLLALPEELEDEEEGGMEWIPVTERLPEIGRRTLIYQDGQQHAATFRPVEYRDGSGTLNLWDGDECETFSGVTHWMPLPPPPPATPPAPPT
jgi:hypothetical protein